MAGPQPCLTGYIISLKKLNCQPGRLNLNFNFKLDLNLNLNLNLNLSNYCTKSYSFTGKNSIIGNLMRRT
jgi:hypothetical protein